MQILGIFPVFIRQSEPKKEKDHKRQEKTEIELLAASDYYIVVSIGMHAAVKQLLQKYEYEIKDNCLVIENGFNNVENTSAQKEIIEFAEKARNSNKVILYYAGTGSVNIHGKKGKALKSFSGYFGK